MFKNIPGASVVGFTVHLEEGSFVPDGGHDGFVRHGHVGEGFLDIAFLHVLDVFEAKSLGADGVAVHTIGDPFSNVLDTFLPRKTDTGKASISCEYDASLLVVPGIRFVVTHNAEAKTI